MKNVSIMESKVVESVVTKDTENPNEFPEYLEPQLFFAPSTDCCLYFSPVTLEEKRAIMKNKEKTREMEMKKYEEVLANLSAPINPPGFQNFPDEQQQEAGNNIMTSRRPPDDK